MLLYDNVQGEEARTITYHSYIYHRQPPDGTLINFCIHALLET